MSIIKVDPNDKYPRVYWPEELKRFGYTGEVEVICDSGLHPLGWAGRARRVRPFLLLTKYSEFYH